jgi:hypothetical protein
MNKMYEELLEKLKNAPLHVESYGTQFIFKNKALLPVLVLNEAIETIDKQKEELQEAQELIKKLYFYSGSSADSDFRLWQETEKYCKEKGIAECYK